MPFNSMVNQCTARTKRTGERCRCAAANGCTVCYHHGAHPTNQGGRKRGCDNSQSRIGHPPGHTNSLKHGACFARLPPDEQRHFETIKAAFEEELGGGGSLSASDRLLIFRLATNGAKITVATEMGAPADALVPLQRLELELLRELKATRATRDGGSATGNSPAEVLAAFLEQAHRRGVLPRPVTALPPSDNTDVEALDVVSDDDQDV